MSNEVKSMEFISQFNCPKIVHGEEFYPEDDICDQRAPINDPESLYNQFVIPEELYDDLDNETLDDFEGDVYDYDDRTDLGVDIALAAELERQGKKSIKKQNKEKRPEEEVAVSESRRSAAEQAQAQQDSDETV